MKVLAQLVLICSFLGCAEQNPYVLYSGTYHNSQKNDVILTLSSDGSFLMVAGTTSGSGLWIDADQEKKLELIFDKQGGKELSQIVTRMVNVEPNSDLTLNNGWRFYKVSD